MDMAKGSKSKAGTQENAATPEAGLLILLVWQSQLE